MEIISKNISNEFYLNERKKHSVLFFAFSLVFASLGTSFSWANYCSVGVAMFIVMSIINIFAIISAQQQMFSNLLVFWGFSCIYGLHGPLSIVTGSSFNSCFGSSVFNCLSQYLVAFGISSIGIIIGTVIFYNKRKYVTNIQNNLSGVKTSTIITGMYITSVLATITETINILRIGGFSILFEGKASFQAAANGLSLTLPSGTFFSICGMYIGLYLARMHSTNELPKYPVILTILFFSPFFLYKTLLGQRGIIISIIISAMACYAIVNPIKKIRIKMILLFFIAYLFLSFLYANRGIVSLLLSNPDHFWELAFDTDRLSSSKDPGNSEFSAAFGNFCIYYEKYGNSNPLQFGLSYIKGLVIPIPSFLYPGTKPLQITYAFRDEFFLSWASRSRIASTGFSSILEAYMNWGHIGIFAMYLLYGYVICKIDNNRSVFKTEKQVLMYAAITPNLISFSRMALGDVFASYVFSVVIIIAISQISNMMYKK